MITASIPMWTKENSFIPLIEIIELFDDNDLIWSVLSFDGSGKFPNGADWDDFQNKVDLGEAIFSWAEIQEFAWNLDQMYEGEIMARSTTSAHALIAIDVFDSTEYDLSVNPSIMNEALDN